jgi:hypothetical protein
MLEAETEARNPPQRVRYGEFIDELLIGASVVDAPSFCFVDGYLDTLMGSLIPQFRGSSPIRRAIITFMISLVPA